MIKENPIEVCIAINQRPHRFAKIIEQLLNQTRQDFNLNIWNSSGVKLDRGIFPEDRLRMIFTNINTGGQDRFMLAPRTKGRTIIFIDDDESLEKDFIDYNFKELEKWGRDCILGWYVRIFDKESYWNSKPNIVYGEEVDYVGTGGMVLDREIFDLEAGIYNMPIEHGKGTCDLYLCYLARMKYKMRMIKIDKKISIENDGLDTYLKLKSVKNEKGNYKEESFRELRRKGFRVLKDNY